MTEYFMIEYRKRTLVPTPGSQRRCYDGCFHPSDWKEQWTNWDWLELKLSQEVAERRLKFWEDLNTYAVKERGAFAKQEFRIVNDKVYDGTW